MAVGDVMLSRIVARKVRAAGDIHYPFLKVRDYLNEADVVWGNLESPILERPPLNRGVMAFQANPGIEQALREAGFTIMSLANNHMMDYDEQGLTETMQCLGAAGIAWVGAGRDAAEACAPIYLQAKGLTFAFLAYVDPSLVRPASEAGSGRAGVAVMDLDRMTAAVRQAGKRADFVLVGMHSGDEYQAEPNAYQTVFARAAIDAGAELVIGHHPHVIQPIEKYRGKYILYSLGNFIFDQSQPGTRESAIAEIVFDRMGVARIGLVPLVIEDYCQPRIVNPDTVPDLIERFRHHLAERHVFVWEQEAEGFEIYSWPVIQDRRPLFGRLAKVESRDLDGDGTPESYTLQDGVLTVRQGSEVIWVSAPKWWIEDFVLADSTNDGEINLNVSLWKAWSFGSRRPFWVEEDDPSVKNHLFVFALRRGRMRPVWSSSNLAAPIWSFAFADVDNDSRNELVLVEGSYCEGREWLGDYVTVWRWGSWGFVNKWRSPRGRFGGLQIVEIEGTPHILVDSLAGPPDSPRFSDSSPGAPRISRANRRGNP